MTKTCSRCQVEKPLGEFYKSKTAKDGLYPQCKNCKKEYSEKYHRLGPKIKKEKRVLLASLGMKTCSKCGEVKAFNKFYKHKKNKDGFRSACKECEGQYQKKYFSDPKNKEKQAKRHKNWREENQYNQKQYKHEWYQLNKQKADSLSRQRLLEMPAGIYKITNKKTGIFYIGCSVQIYRRLSEHKNALKKNKHKNGLIQEAYNKHGLDVFEFEIIKYYPADTPFKVLEKEETRIILENKVKGIPMYNRSIKINSIDENLLTI